MRATDVDERCNEIAALDDPDEIHYAADELALEVLLAIANGECDDPTLCVRYVAALLAGERKIHAVIAEALS